MLIPIPGNNVGLYSHAYVSSFVRTSLIFNGNINQIHMCQTEYDWLPVNLPWMAVFKLEPSLRRRHHCNNIITKAKLAITNGATAVIFDVKHDKNYSKLLNKKHRILLTRPVLVVSGRASEKLQRVLFNYQAAMASIKVLPVNIPSEKHLLPPLPLPPSSSETPSMVSYKTSIISSVCIVCLSLFIVLLLFIKIRKQRNLTLLKRNQPIKKVLEQMKVMTYMELNSTHCSNNTNSNNNHTDMQQHSTHSCIHQQTAKVRQHINARYDKPHHLNNNYCNQNQSSKFSNIIIEKHCIICYEDYKKDDLIRLLPCFHIFHKRCVDRWLILKKTCPLCLFHVLTDAGSDQNKTTTTTSIATATRSTTLTTITSAFSPEHHPMRMVHQDIHNEPANISINLFSHSSSSHLTKTLKDNSARQNVNPTSHTSFAGDLKSLHDNTTHTAVQSSSTTAKIAGFISKSRSESKFVKMEKKSPRRTFLISPLTLQKSSLPSILLSSSSSSSSSLPPEAIQSLSNKLNSKVLLLDAGTSNTFLNSSSSSPSSSSSLAVCVPSMNTLKLSSSSLSSSSPSLLEPLQSSDHIFDNHHH
ncbi:hypothetical protein HELRODRAFT_162362 [Helobdella robusta]|uniref:RING-type E3 ubiquitin transferase n=1 Tax=Helobdella robusta TaxID=6412 RepID=T1ESK3_HELRO|nr:hypothetical protein HELRODRAFT_162362 [Helobdella robusta]ESN98896.1 hypothetical protein HELRODRAFT_162362 [Helobdella robusta]